MFRQLSFQKYLFDRNAGLELTAGQRTMSGQKQVLSSQILR